MNTKPTEETAATEPVTAEEAATQMAYVAQQQLDGYAEVVAHAIKRKAVFNKRVLAHKPGEVSFSKGQLVQIYQSDLDYTFKTDRKLLPKWSPPQRVVERNLNLYTLERVDRTPIPGNFSARRLRGLMPREGTKLAEEQAEVDRKMAEERAGVGDDNAMGGEEPDEEDKDRWPQDEDEDTGESQTAHQAMRTPPHRGGAHGVVDCSSMSRDLAGDLADDSGGR